MSELPVPARLLASMDDFRASDLFLTEGKVPALRVDGSLKPLGLPPTSAAEMEDLLALVLRPAQREVFEQVGDLDIGWSLPGRKQRFRLNLSRQQGRRAVVARAVPSGALEFEALGLPPEVARLAERQRGLVLVTGATGSGKSTTLAALIHAINSKRKAHIVTLEDPIEFVHEDLVGRVAQREIGNDTESFAAALREIVRQSPDVILIGEMRDAETMQVAMSAALTGHLVFASVHTIDATQTLQRIMSYFPEHLRGQVGMDLSLSLEGIVSQRLVPRASGEGRVVAVEVVTGTPSVRKLLREQRVDELFDLMRSSSDAITFNHSLIRLLHDGTIDHEMGMAHATNPEEFALLARGMATGLEMFRDEDGGDDHPEMDMQALLRQVLDRGASDLHLSVGRAPILRIAGELEHIGHNALTETDMRILLWSILSGRQRSIYELDREIDFALALDGGRRFRVNAYYQKGRMACALRAISEHVPSAEELGLPEALLRLGTRPQGLLLVVGPTGAGKSTTLACLVDRINHTRACRIITIEDPIEYAHESDLATIDQREVGADTKSFARALKYVLRQDPDVILVGEMRDIETISAAITAAETGHLVLATLHANDAMQSIDRIIDAFPSHQQHQARAQLAASLLGIVSQRLIPVKAGGGRVAAFEIMVANSAIRNLVRENKMHQARSAIEAGRRDGMQTLDASIADLYGRRLIGYEDALRYLSDPRKIPAPGRSRAAGSNGRPEHVGAAEPAGADASPGSPTAADTTSQTGVKSTKWYSR